MNIRISDKKTITKYKYKNLCLAALFITEKARQRKVRIK